MAAQPQSYRTHARWFPMYHFFASPVTGLYALHSLLYLTQHFSWWHLAESLFACALFAGVLSSRIMAVTVQNRLVRLEMRLRLKEVLPAAMHARIPELRVKQLIALRFASDAELPGLVERTLKGEFATHRDIKRAITDWQPDYLRV
ncbi:MAG: hypothetical protein KF709_07775 [Gemmatimonadaceae bacterium]|nr:hypothetical protein [Gemmatimonadaceae bacterium]